MSYIAEDLRNGYVLFLGEFNEALLEGRGWNENLIHFWNVNFMVYKLYVSRAVRNNKTTQNSSSIVVSSDGDIQYTWGKSEEEILKHGAHPQQWETALEVSTPFGLHLLEYDYSFVQQFFLQGDFS